MKRLALLVALVSLGYPFNVLPRDHFNSALLENNRPEIKGVDLSSFENGMQRAGKYRVDIILNNDFFASKDINFSNGEDGELTPCLSMDFLKNLGVLVANFPELKETDGCVNFKVISQASANYDLSSQELQLSIPQAALSQKFADL
ncbi:FimD/PapC N-terminal domain-containing protein [Citrobacter amalonaticus]|uniref:FimD/PapC N-terminal domain-containing protein n=1 Tax=Citrobacter amalonaticus TaxID=35703 RepID=UPI001CE4AFD2|nr:FimD/PapC N-terminal domain-containing protein [Citrobacter amalonaticus]